MPSLKVGNRRRASSRFDAIEDVDRQPRLVEDVHPVDAVDIGDADPSGCDATTMPCCPGGSATQATILGGLSGRRDREDVVVLVPEVKRASLARKPASASAKGEDPGPARGHGDEVDDVTHGASQRTMVRDAARYAGASVSAGGCDCASSPDALLVARASLAAQTLCRSARRRNTRMRPLRAAAAEGVAAVTEAPSVPCGKHPPIRGWAAYGVRGRRGGPPPPAWQPDRPPRRSVEAAAGGDGHGVADGAEVRPSHPRARTSAATPTVTANAVGGVHQWATRGRVSPPGDSGQARPPDPASRHRH